jgi:hypothetical protein
MMGENNLTRTEVEDSPQEQLSVVETLTAATYPHQHLPERN